jgi:hypothetical protein
MSMAEKRGWTQITSETGILSANIQRDLTLLGFYFYLQLLYFNLGSVIGQER